MANTESEKSSPDAVVGALLPPDVAATLRILPDTLVLIQLDLYALARTDTGQTGLALQQALRDVGNRLGHVTSEIVMVLEALERSRK